MRYPNLKKIIQPNMSLTGMLVLVYLVSWVLNYFNIPDIQNYSSASIRVIQPNPLWLTLIIFLITIFNILLIIQINSKYSIIRVKTFLPVFFFALFISAWKESHLLCLSHLALTIFLLSLLLFMGMYRNKKAVEPAFLGSLLISLTGIINPVYLFLLPITWIGFIILKCFSTRVFLASLMGLLIPWLFYFSYQWYTGNEIHHFDTLIFEFEPTFLLTGRALHEKIYIAFVVVSLIISLAGVYTNMLNDSIQTRKNINLILLYLIFLVILVFSFAKHALAFLPFIAFCFAMLFAHPFSLNKSKFYPLFFIFFCLVNITYMILNYLII
jgi:hypothetical protein